MKETPESVYVGQIEAEKTKETETVYSNREIAEATPYSSDEKDEVEAQQTEETIYSDADAAENPYSDDERNDATISDTEANLPEKIVTQAEEKMGFSDNEVDKDNRFHQSFIGVPTLPKGSIQLNKKLGEGAFGQVYRGTWGKENRPVALKKIDLDHARGNFKHLREEEILESLQWEVTRLSTVSHPNCVQFYGIYQHKRNTRTYVVMEFCEGGTLMLRNFKADFLQES